MKRMRKILVGLMAMVMLLGMSLTVSAADGYSVTAINGIGVKGAVDTDTKGNPKVTKKSSITIYTNDDSQNTELEVLYTYTEGVVTDLLSGLKVTSANKDIVTAELISAGHYGDVTKGNTVTHYGKAVLKIHAVNNGKAKITVASKATKKSAAITVTVKTWADKVEFSNSDIVTGVNHTGEPRKNDANPTATDGTIYLAQGDIELANVKGSTLNLGAYVTTSSASNAKLTYEVEKLTNATGKQVKNSIVSCDSKGNVKIAKVAASTDVLSDGGYGTIIVHPADATKQELARIKVKLVEDSSDRYVKGISFIADKEEKNTKVANVEYGNLNFFNKKYVLYLKGNKGSVNNTYQLLCDAGAAQSVGDLVFASNKESVATVDKNGKITAVGNGTATITASPKLGNSNKAKATVTVTVDTDVEYINVASTKFTIRADNKDSASINAVTNSNAKTKTVTYAVTGVTVKDENGDEKAYGVNQKNKKLTELNEDGSNGADTALKLANYVSVSSKGVVKAKAQCVATITVTSKAQKISLNPLAEVKDYATAKVEVTATDYATELLIATTKAEADKMTGTEITIKTDKKKRDYISAAKVYKTGEKSHTELHLSVDGVMQSGNPINSKAAGVTWKSSKPTVATVGEDGTVTVVGSGSTKITATAAGGKTASVTVTGYVDAYEITHKAKVGEPDSEGVYPIYVDTTKEFTLGTLINASVNANATKTGVTYIDNSTNKTVAATKKLGRGISGIVGTYTVQPSDSKGFKPADPLKFEIIGVKAESTEITVYNGDKEVTDLALKAGDKVNLTATTLGENGAPITLTDVKWTHTNKNVATVSNGVVTAKKANAISAPITVTSEGKEPKTIEVYVGVKDADAQKAINSALTTKLNEENRDHTGLKATFNSKTNAITMKILDPNRNFADVKDTGVIAGIKEIGVNLALSNNLVSDEVVINDTTNGKKYSITRMPGSEYDGLVSISDGTTTKDNLTIDEAMQEVLTSLGSRSRLAELNGIHYELTFKLHYLNMANTDIKYEFTYAADVSMDKNAYDSLIDARIQAGLDLYNNHGKVDVLDNKSLAEVVAVDYNAGSNAFDVVVKDVDVPVENIKNEMSGWLEATLEELKDAAKDEFGDDEYYGEAEYAGRGALADVQEITVAFSTSDGKVADTITKYRSDDKSRVAIEELVRAYWDKIKDEESGKVNIGALDGSMASANVTFRVGNLEYVLSYSLNFRIDPDAIDAAVDKRIETKISEYQNSLIKRGLYVDYKPEINTLPLTIDVEKLLESEGNPITAGTAYKANMSFIWSFIEDNYKDSNRIKEIFGELLGSEYADFVKDAQVAFNGESTTLKIEEEDDAFTIGGRFVEALFGEGSDILLRDVNGMTATVKVNYDIYGVKKTLLYTIKFNILEPEDDSDESEEAILEEDELLLNEDEAIVDETEETVEDETEEAIEEETTEEDTEEGSTDDADDGTDEDKTGEATEDETDEENSEEGSTEDADGGTAEEETEDDVSDGTADELNEVIPDEVNVEETAENIVEE